MALKMNELPTQEEMVKNVLYTFLNASTEDMEEGMAWYKDAFEECVRIAEEHELDLQTVVSLVSVISPSIMWGGNITMPEKIIDLWKRGVPVEEWEGFNCYPANLHKAVAILNGDLSQVKGLKVTAFRDNILGHTEPVTIDRWAIRVVMNTPKLGTDKITPSGKGVYNAIADAYREAANLLDLETMDVQAVTWVVYRNKYNGKVRKEKERLAARKYAVA